MPHRWIYHLGRAEPWTVLKISSVFKSAKFKENRNKALDQLSEDLGASVQDTLNHLLNLELSMFLSEPDQSDNKKNGFKEREYTFKGIGTIRIYLPQDRKSRFESSITKRSERNDSRIKEDIAVLHLAGISNRTLAMISKRVLGLEVLRVTL
jgi:transposase-like protein